MKFPDLPAALELYKIESNIMIDPIPKSKVMGVLYIVTSVNNTMRSGILNGCAVLMQESNVAFNLSFICVDTSINFFIGKFNNANSLQLTINTVLKYKRKI